MKTIRRFIGIAVLSTFFASSGWAAAPTPKAAEPPKAPATVYALMKQRKELSKFTDLVASSGLEDALTKKDETVTLFVPTNDAMEKLPSSVAKRIKADKEDKKAFVLYHMIIGSQVQSGNILHRRAGVGSGSGEMIAFDGMGKDLLVNESKIVLPDLAAPNGVVHEIDAALISPTLLEKPVEKKPEESAKKEQEKPAAEGAQQPAGTAEKPSNESATVPSAAASSASSDSAAAKGKASLWDKLKGWWNK